MKIWTAAASAIAVVSFVLPGTAPVFAAVESFTLDEGTTMALVEDHAAPVVTIRLLFPAGVWSPWVRAAHAQEAFEFQLRDSQGKLRERAQALACEIGLGMGSRSSGLTATFLRDDLDAVAVLIRDVLANRDYDRRELVAARRGEDLAWGLDERDPEFALQQEAAVRLFDESDPRLAPWDAPEKISTNAKKLAAARDVLVRLPGRLVGFAGAITREEAERIARALLPAPSKEGPADLAPRLSPLRESAGEDDDVPLEKLTQVYFSWVRPSLTWSDPDDPAFLIADHVLGGHFYSRLYAALRHDGGETYGADSDSTGDVVAGVYSLTTFTKTENAATTEKKLRRVLAEFHDKGITAEERADAARHLVGRGAFARQSPNQVLGTWLQERLLGLPPGWFDNRARKAAALSLDEINAFIRRWYDPAAFTMLRAVPEE